MVFYIYSWLVVGVNMFQLMNFGLGIYIVMVMDSNGCFGIVEYVIVEVMLLVVMIEILVYIDVDFCNGIVIVIVFGGIFFYIYEWLNIFGIFDESVVEGLCNGIYML